MYTLPHIIFHVGGPVFHPVRDQAERIREWLGDKVTSEVYDGVEAFLHLERADLLVLMGLHWTGMEKGWAGNLTYHPMMLHHQQAFEEYVASGRPLLCHHGAIGSYNDWPRFGELLGFTWVWGTTAHSPIDTYTVQVLPTGHPIVADVTDYTLYDELYYNVQITPELNPTIHAHTSWDHYPAPMVLTAEGGRIPGAGRVVYLANGHDLRAFENAMLARLWVNAVIWLLD